MTEIHSILAAVFFWTKTLFFLLLIAGIVIIACIIVIDAKQHKDAIRHNYPFIARFRSWFMHLGVFFRAYFFTEDREELPFNRADRSWVARASANRSMEKAFGSTREIARPGSVLFVNTSFPPLERDCAKPGVIEFGPFTPNPYRTDKFFHISAMSYGALSKPAVQALSYGAKLAGIMMDTGEGGIAPWHLEGGCDLVAEIGTAKYGFRTPDGKLDDDKLRQAAAREQVKMFSLKLGQGAKPGIGGLLPAEKVTPEIAEIRGIPVGKSSISPNRWPEIGNIEELLDMIEHVRHVTGKPTGCKLVPSSAERLHKLCLAIHKRGIESAPDFIIVDGADGGSGAAPASLMDYMGLTLYESLPMTVDALMRNGLRERVKVGCSGKLITPGKVAWALCMGADFINSARGFMFSLGCIQAMRCNKNTCPTGVTTHKPHLQAGLDPRWKKVKVMHYAMTMHRQVGMIAHSCGVTDPRQLRRRHVRLVDRYRRTVSAEHIFPYPEAASTSTK